MPIYVAYLSSGYYTYFDPISVANLHLGVDPDIKIMINKSRETVPCGAQAEEENTKEKRWSQTVVVIRVAGDMNPPQFTNSVYKGEIR